MLTQPTQSFTSVVLSLFLVPIGMTVTSRLTVWAFQLLYLYYWCSMKLATNVCVLPYAPCTLWIGPLKGGLYWFVWILLLFVCFVCLHTNRFENHLQIEIVFFLYENVVEILSIFFYHGIIISKYVTLLWLSKVLSSQMCAT